MGEVKLPEVDGVDYRLVSGFPAYAIGNDGSIWTRHNNRWGMGEWKPMSPVASRSGHLAVNLCGGGSSRSVLVHHLVLEEFDRPMPEGMECRHMDGNPQNNHIGNLKWGTRLENQRDRYRHGTDQFGERNHRSKLTEQDVVRIRELYATGDYYQKELAEMFGVSRKAICWVVRGDRWPNAGGPIADYSDRKFRFDSETARKAKKCEKLTR